MAGVPVCGPTRAQLLMGGAVTVAAASTVPGVAAVGNDVLIAALIILAVACAAGLAWFAVLLRRGPRTWRAPSARVHRVLEAEAALHDRRLRASAARAIPVDELAARRVQGRSAPQRRRASS